MNLDPNRGFSREGHKLLQLVNLLFQIFVRFQSRAMTNKKERVVHSLVYASQKKKKEKKGDQLFQNLSMSWISAYFQFPLVYW